MKNKILSKFNSLKTWQKIIVVAVGVLILPVAVVILLLGIPYRDGTLISLVMGKKKEDIERRIERSEKKEEELIAKETAIKIEKEALLKEIERNEKKHATYTGQINSATTIDELRAIARSIRE